MTDSRDVGDGEPAVPDEDADAASRSPVRRGVAIIAAGAVLFSVVAVGATLVLDRRAAGDCAYEHFVPRLTTIPVLAQHPPGATRIEARNGCPSDDRAAATREFRFAGARDTVHAFYRDAALRDGWSEEPLRSETADTCYKKTLGTEPASLTVKYFEGGYAIEARIPPGC